MLSEAGKDFCEGEGSAYASILEAVAQEAKLPRYSVDMVFLLMEAPALLERYGRMGISEEIYWDSLADLRYKLAECKGAFGLWGTFVLSWYRGFYRCTRFALGRMQYERAEFPYEEYGGVLKQGDTVYKCHIPSSGPLDGNAVIGSLKRAHAFFEKELKDGLLPVFCSSWLLYPPHAPCFREGSNLRRFYEMFTVLEQIEKPENPDFWRVFNMHYDPATLADAPADTFLRAGLKEFLLAGNCMGNGRGVLLFDGENILK